MLSQHVDIMIRVLVPAKESLIKPRPYRILRKKQEALLIIGPNRSKHTFFLPTQQAANFQVYNKLSESFALTHTRSILLIKNWN